MQTVKVFEIREKQIKDRSKRLVTLVNTASIKREGADYSYHLLPRIQSFLRPCECTRLQHVALERGRGGQRGFAAYFLGSNRETAIEHIESNQQQ